MLDEKLLIGWLERKTKRLQQEIDDNLGDSPIKELYFKGGVFALKEVLKQIEEGKFNKKEIDENGSSNKPT